jgi:hypothetical protein
MSVIVFRWSRAERLSRFALTLVFLLALTSGASGQNVEVSKAEMNRATWSSAALYHSYVSNDASTTLLLLYSYQLFKQNPHMAANLALKDMNKYRESLQSLESQVVEGYSVSPRFKNTATALLDLAAASKAPNAAAGAALTKALLSLGYEGLEAFWHSGTQISAQRQLLGMTRDADGFIGDSAAGLWDLAQKDPQVGDAVDAFFGSTFRSSVHDSASRILKKNPELAQQESVRNIEAALKPDGSFTGSIKDLKDGFRSSTSALSKTIQDNTLEFKKLKAKMEDMWKEQAAAAEAQRHFESTRTAISSGAGAIQLITRLIGLQNKDLANTLQTIGNSVVQVASSINDYGHDLATLEQDFGSFGTFLGTAALANGLVGAVFNLAGAFDDSSRSTLAELASIKQEIQQLRQEVFNMHVEMRLSFLHIDAKLDAAIDLVNAGFQATITKLNNIQVDLVSVRQQLLQEAAGIDVLRRDILQYSKDILITPYLSDVNQCLGYKERNPGSVISTDEYDRCVSRFHTWGTTIAKSSTLSGSGDFNERVLYEQGSPILTRSTDETINSLASLAETWQLIPAQQVAPNPLMWSSATDAFIALSTQWPDRFLGQSPSVELDLVKTGQQLTGFSRALTLTVTAEGKPVGNYAVFKKSVNLYEADLTIFSALLKSLATGWLNEKYPDTRFHSAILNNYSSDQEIGVSTTANTCEGAALKSGLQQLQNLLVNYDIGLENALKPNFITFCYKGSYQATRTTWANANKLVWAQVVAEATGTISWENRPYVIYRSSVTSRDFPTTAGGTYLYPDVVSLVPLYDPAAFLSTNWKEGERIADSFNSVRNLSDEEKGSLKTIETAIHRDIYENLLPSIRKELNEYLINQFASNTTLAEASRRLAVSKTLLNDFVELALPRSYGTDNIRRLFRGDSGLWDKSVVMKALDSNESLDSIFATSAATVQDTKIRIANAISVVESTGQPEVNELILMGLDRLKMVNSLRATDRTTN